MRLAGAQQDVPAPVTEAGYKEEQIAEIKKTLDNYLNLREIIRKASGETLDLKSYEIESFTIPIERIDQEMIEVANNLYSEYLEDIENLSNRAVLVKIKFNRPSEEVCV